MRRDRLTGHATYMVEGTHDAPTRDFDATVIHVPHRPGDPKLVPFDEWCEANQNDLRRMLRYVRSRMPNAHLDWDGVARSLSRFTYTTSVNRKKASPAIR